MKNMRSELENISADLDTISRSLEFVCHACTYCDSREMLYSAIDSVRVAHTALVQSSKKLDSAICQIEQQESAQETGRCNG